MIQLNLSNLNAFELREQILYGVIEHFGCYRCINFIKIYRGAIIAVTVVRKVS
jgi:hypothetical protein